MKYRIENAKYTVLEPQELWNFYTGAWGLYRGGGAAQGPKLIKATGPRSRDVTIIFDTEQEIEVVIPDPTKGISFSDNIQRLSKNPIISGHAWMLPQDKTLPEGLVFNVKATLCSTSAGACL